MLCSTVLSDTYQRVFMQSKSVMGKNQENFC